MLAASTHPMWAVWSGGDYTGVNTPSSRVTVETGWSLQTSSGTIGTYDVTRLPVRHFISSSTPPVETEVPNVKTVHITRSLDQDAASCDLEIYNQSMTPSSTTELGNPGYFTHNRGSSGNRWGHTTNAWADVLVPNALIKTYQGYGGQSKTIPQAVSDGNLIQTGCWLIDEVRIGTDGMISIRCRDMAKLLIEQFCYVPLVPYTFYGQAGIHYSFVTFWTVADTPKIDYGSLVGNVKTIQGGGAGIVFTDPLGNKDLGYWLFGSDGGVFTYGMATFYGSLGGYTLNAPIVGLEPTHDKTGYWLVGEDGGVFAFGSAGFFGSPVGITVSPVVGMASRPTDAGYWVVSDAGAIYAYGDATYYGGTPSTPAPIVDIEARPQGDGYWLLNAEGQVYAYGSAGFYGNAPNDVSHPAVAIASSPSGLGYYIVDNNGAVFAFGDAQYRGGANNLALNDPVNGIVVAGDGSGYWLIAGDGGVFAYNVPFYGSLVGRSPGQTFATVGNYTDYTQIVRDLLLWSGFWYHPNVDGDGNPTVYGGLESTGAAAIEPISPDIFDKKPVMEPLTRIKEGVAYIFCIREDGSAHFASPNFWGPGNFLPTGIHTNYIPVVDEIVQLINYGVSFNDQTARSSIVVASNEPTLDLSDTVTTTVVPPSAVNLRGMVRPTVIFNPFFTTAADQQVMAELLGMQMWFQERLGQVDCVANPLIQLDDQIRIYERQTEEMLVHYVRSIDTTHDLDSGSYQMTMQTHQLGDPSSWTIVHP